MVNQYIWLYNNLEKYKFNTDEAKQIYNEFKSINITNEEQLDDDVVAMLSKCYDAFVKLFNNNPFCYKNGLNDIGIETNDFDCYFIDNNGTYLPIGYYKEKHPVESVLLLGNKINEQKNKTKDIKTSLVSEFEKDSQNVATRVEALKKSKKANFVRAILASVSGVLILLFTVLFLKVTNIFEILKNIGDKQLFSEAIKSGMYKMPVLFNAGVFVWFLLLILHIILTISVIKKIKDIKTEFVLSYQRSVASRFKKLIKKCVDKINIQFSGSLEKDAQTLIEATRQGESTQIEKNSLSHIIKKAKNRTITAKKFVENSYNNIRGIQHNKTIVFLVIVALIGSYIYLPTATPDYNQTAIQMRHEKQIKMDQMVLRSKKLVFLASGNGEIYKSASWGSKIKRIIPTSTVLELCDQKISNGESWSKVKVITDNDVIKGWVPTVNLWSYNNVDFSNLLEVGVVSTESSSNLVGANCEYHSDYAVDGLLETTWQEGNQYSSGENEFIRLNFESATEVDMIQIVPGNSCDLQNDSFNKNPRIKRARLNFSNGKSVTCEFDDAYGTGFQVVWLNKPVVTEYVEIEIIEVYYGAEYSDLCISEVDVFRIFRG